MTQFHHLHRFLERFKQLGFWQRLFGWRRMRQEAYQAFAEFSQLVEQVQRLGAEQQTQREKLIASENSVGHLTNENQALRADIKPLRQRIEELSQENLRLRKEEEQRAREHERKIEQATQLYKQLDSDRRRLDAERQAEVEARFEAIRKAWSMHEEQVKQRLRQICVKHQVGFVEDHNLEKKPDCVIRIGGEYVVFDAKSPGDPSKPESFNGYVRNQISELDKYAKQEGVRKELFLVVPNEVIAQVPQLIYQVPGYTVHVISTDALEPIVFGLKRLESYALVDELSPEEREVICGVIGKFVHLSKRRVQIDQHWAFEILSLLSKSKSLPGDFTELIAKYEKDGLYNPEPDRRGKSVPDDTVRERREEIERMIEPAPQDILNSLF